MKTCKNELELIVEALKDKYGFRGLYHFTDISNLPKIFSEGKIHSREFCEKSGIGFKNAANMEVIEKTDENVKNCVRFYYKEKTPTLYSNEGIKYKLSENEPHVPIPVYFLFNPQLIYHKNSFFYDGNAGSQYTSCGNDSNFFKYMDWNKIFHRGSLYGYEEVEQYIITRCRNAELLYNESVSLEYVDEIIFRSNADFKRAVQMIGEDERFRVDREMFNCKNNFVEDYNLKKYETNDKYELEFTLNKKMENLDSNKITVFDLKDSNLEEEGNVEFYMHKDTEFKYRIVIKPKVDVYRIQLWLYGILSIDIIVDRMEG